MSKASVLNKPPCEANLNKARHGGVAQLVERLPCKQEASGSNPLISTMYGLIAQLVRAHA